MSQTGFDAVAYLRDRGIPFDTEGKNCSPGWIQIRCPRPVCGDHSNHGGFSLEDGRYRCWKCKGHPVEEIIMLIDRVTYHEACQIKRDYPLEVTQTFQRVAHLPPESLKLPLGTAPLGLAHRRYLEKRGFDPDRLIERFDVRGTGPVGDYSHRLVIPIYFEGRMISYQTRDITGRAVKPYLACEPALELMSHKTILYNIDNCLKDRVIVVEGVTDVWRIFDDVCGTFGVGFTWGQLILLNRRFKQVFFVYDGESLAQAKAREALKCLAGMGTKTINILLNEGDPGSMSQDLADRLRREIIHD